MSHSVVESPALECGRTPQSQQNTAVVMDATSVIKSLCKTPTSWKTGGESPPLALRT